MPTRPINYYGTLQGDGANAPDNSNWTAYGNAAADYLTGGAGQDWIAGGAGWDTIVGGLGNDVLDGDAMFYDGAYSWFAGDDTVFGEGGDDRIGGGLGRDLLDGGTGNDVILGDSNVLVLRDRANSNAPFTNMEAQDIGPAYSASNTYDDRITGGDGNDLIYAGHGADRIDGDGLFYWSTDPNNRGAYTGVDTIYGEGGDDIIGGGGGSDIIDGGADNDTIFGDGYVMERDAATNTYTDVVKDGAAGGADILRGGTGNDSVYGGAGNDEVYGDDGNDYLYGGNDNDKIYGGAGLDVMFGEGGDDILQGGVGNDTLDGGEGVDQITGEDGDDTLVGWNGNDVVRGGAGADRIDGDGFYRDNITSAYASGNDTLYGDAGNDVIAGGAGDDTIDGGTEDDLLLGDGLVIDHDLTGGGVGVYKPVFGYGPYADVNNSGPTEGGTDNINGGEGNDTIFAGGGADKAYGGAGDDKIDGGHGKDELFGGDGIDRLMGGGGDDILRGGAGDDRMDGDGSYANGFLTGNYTGADTLYGEAGNDVMAGGEGNDMLDGGDDDDRLFGDSGVLQLTRIDGGALDTILDSTSFGLPSQQGGNDTLKGGAGNDTLSGEGGDDILDGGTGKDVMFGGYGNDLFYVDQSDDEVGEFEFGGNDRVLTTVNYALGADAEVETLEAVGGNAELILTGNKYNQRIVGNAGGNVLRGEGGNDVLEGGGGSDVLLGGTGDDSLSGGADGDVLEGGAGSDTIDGGDGSDTAVYSSDVVYTITTAAGVTRVASSEGADTLKNIETLRFLGLTMGIPQTPGATVVGSNAGDAVDGTAQNDLMYGFNGNDALNGGDGDDRLLGGRGNDTLNGGAGLDTADYSLAASAVTANLQTGGASNDGDGGSDTFIGIENLTGSLFNDILTGNSGDNVLRGGRGNDTLDGGGGVDMADYSTASSAVTARLDIMKALNDGDGGVDTLSGIEGLIGSNFNDTLIGGALGDTLKGGLGSDTLLGFAGNDVLWGGAGAANTLQGGLGDDLYVLEANDSITELAGEGLDTVDVRIAIYNLAANVENMFFGGTGNFTGIGNALNNTITGGAGDDILSGRGGTDILQGGAGIDIADYSQAAGAIHARLDVMRAVTDGDGATDTYVSIEGITGSDFNDLLVGGANADRLSGGFGADTLLGGGGNDILAGGQGLANQLQGGAGDDYYILDALDTVVELANEGYDVIEAHVGAHIMGANIEDMFYVGYNKFYGTGNALNNVIKGGIGDDILKGMGGNDSLFGGEGRDEVQFRGAKAQYTVTAEGAGYRVVDSIAGRDGSTYVDSIEILRFMTDGAVTTLTYPRQTISAEPETKSGAALVSPLMDDDAFLLPEGAQGLRAETRAHADALWGGETSLPLNLVSMISDDWTPHYEARAAFAADFSHHDDFWF